jgi:hypothetical protein
MKLPVQAEVLSWFWTPLFPAVGLAPNATVQVTLHTKKPSPNAFVVVFSEPQLMANNPLLVPNPGPKQSTYLPCTWRSSLAEDVNASFRIPSQGALRYFFGVLQAVPGAASGISGEVDFVNPDGSQLEVQQRSTPGVVLLMAWAFFGSAAFLAVLVLLRRRARNRLHGLLLVALVVKCLVLLLIRQDVQAMARTGRPSREMEALWQLLRQVQLILEVVVFYTIGLGWKVVRSQLRNSEWAFAAAVSGISFFLGALEVACNTSFRTCGSQSYLLTQFTLHSICFLVVIIATNFNIFTLQRQIAEALAAPETSALYAKHRAYCWFRGFFLYFVIVPTVTNFLALHVVSWDELWVIVLVREGSLWIIYTAVLWLFRPGLSQLRVFPELAVVESSESDSDYSQE